MNNNVKLWDIVCNGNMSKYVIQRSVIDIDLGDNRTYIFMGLGEMSMVCVFDIPKEKFLELSDKQVRKIIDAKNIGVIPFEIWLQMLYNNL
jgi:hypothetical protein